MGYRIVVDFDRCQANAVCVTVAGELFAMDEHDRLTVDPTPPEGMLERAREAANLCPTRAITIVEE